MLSECMWVPKNSCWASISTCWIIYTKRVQQHSNWFLHFVLPLKLIGKPIQCPFWYGYLWYPMPKPPTSVWTCSRLCNSSLSNMCFWCQSLFPFTLTYLTQTLVLSAFSCNHLCNLTPLDSDSIQSVLDGICSLVRSYYIMYWLIISFYLTLVPDLLYLCLGYSSPDFQTSLWKLPCSHT